MSRKTILLICAVSAILIIFIIFSVLPAKKISSVLPSDDVHSVITDTDSSISDMSSSSISNVTDERYERAKNIKLVNFTHPNYDEPIKLVDLKELLAPLSVTVNNAGRYLEEEAAIALKEMIEAANKDGITTFIINSAYRDRKTQQGFWDKHIKENPKYGDDVYNHPVKTVPATASEHCLGLAADILCDSCPGGSQKYAETKEAQWLYENAYKFGFIIRYPDGKQSVTGILFEPWHYRYVGKEAAKDIYESGLCLEEYLEMLNLPLPDEKEN